ncbi:hypothetical protein Z043_103584 [Scleropages formosus]|uniref:Uncharacterized protein n=1 Tax=Scleropages formosus TaxID=113540 RepID=A0A0P7XJM6_SCLFO|nr:hypothetical protein Z043_103584 [Scleropages formosus]
MFRSLRSDRLRGQGLRVLVGGQLFRRMPASDALVRLEPEAAWCGGRGGRGRSCADSWAAPPGGRSRNGSRETPFEFEEPGFKSDLRLLYPGAALAALRNAQHNCGKAHADLPAACFSSASCEGSWTLPAASCTTRSALPTKATTPKPSSTHTPWYGRRTARRCRGFLHDSG